MDEPRTVDTPIRFRSHRGISSGPTTVDRDGVIPAGQTTAVLSAPMIGCGQIDTKAVFTGNGDATGRITAPYITKEDNCEEQATTTTVATTTPTTQPVETTAGTTVITSASSPAPPSSVSQNTVAPPTTAASSTGQLPSTGSGSTWPVAVAGGLLALGLLLLGVGRRTLTP
jgi:LPXTG-motif cell wall-anchored protein